MKKVLLVFAMLAIVSLTACTTTSDCTCDIYTPEGVIFRQGEEQTTNGSLNIFEFLGDCSEANWSDLPDDSWENLEHIGYTIECE